MKRLILVLAAMLTAVLSIHAADYTDSIAARINDTIILESELNEIKMRGGDVSPEEMRAHLEEMIKNKVLYMEALENEEIIVDGDEVEKKLDEMISNMKKNFGSEENFSAALLREGIDENTLRSIYRQQIREEMYVQNYISIVIRPGISVKDEEMEKFYESNKSRFVKPASFSYVIGFKQKAVTAEDEQRTSDFLLQLRKDILSHKISFSDAAVRYSQGPTAERGGDLGLVKKGNMVKEFEDVVMNMKKGEISRPFKTKFGYHIAYLENISDEGRNVRHIIRLPSIPEEMIAKYSENVHAIFAKSGMEGLQEWGKTADVSFIPFEGVGQSEINEYIYKQISGLMPGEISEVDYINNGLTFVYLKDKTPAKQMEYDDVRNYVKNMIYSDKIVKEIDRIYDSLKDKYFIEIMQ